MSQDSWQKPEEEAVNDQQQETPTLESLKAELEEAQREIGQFKALAQRAQADLANFRKRTEEERIEQSRNIAARFILKLLPVLDDMERALNSVPSGAEEAKWVEGVRIIERNLRSLLESEGVTAIEAEGKTFDPWQHEGMFTMEDDSKPDGTVMAVIRPGYKFHGKVIRTAQVGVTKSKEQEPAEPGEAPHGQ